MLLTEVPQHFPSSLSSLCGCACELCVNYSSSVPLSLSLVHSYSLFSIERANKIHISKLTVITHMRIIMRYSLVQPTSSSSTANPQPCLCYHIPLLPSTYQGAVRPAADRLASSHPGREGNLLPLSAPWPVEHFEIAWLKCQIPKSDSHVGIFNAVEPVVWGMI